MHAGSCELKVALLDVDAFYVSVELLRRPELCGKPVVVSGTGPRAVVTTASYEARRFGVGSAIPASRARRLCPEAIFLPPDFPTYRAISKTLMEVLKAHVERVEVVSLDEAYLDLEGFISPRAAMRRVLAEIQRETGLTCSVGIGPNKLVAKVASDAEKPRGFVTLTREQACARFASAPPRLLPGIGPKTAETLAKLGLETIAALAAASPELLRSRFGPTQSLEIARRARFEHGGAVTPVREVVSESRERTFDIDVADAQVLREELARMASELCTSLARHRRSGRTIGIKVRLDDFSTATRARTIAEPTRDVETVTSVALRLLREYDPPRPVRLLGVRVGGFGSAGGGAVAGRPERAEALQDDPQLALPL
jgi:DNA polymerase-4